MKTSNKCALSLIGASSMLLTSLSHAVEIIPIESFDPNTFFADGVTAGIDFNDGTSSNYPDPTQPGFLDVPASNDKVYNVTTDGITFDLQIRNANQGNQNRNRNNVNAGLLLTDFEQWYGSYDVEGGGNEVEGTLTLTGLNPNTDYQISFFTANVGAGQTSTRFYDGATTEDPLITEFRTAGNQNNYDTWSPGITLQMNSGANAEIVVTLQAVESLNTNSGKFDSRLGICGISVVSLGPVVPEVDLEITSVDVDSTAGEATLTFTGTPNTPYACLSSTDLLTFPTSEAIISGSLTTDENGNGSVVVSASEDAKFFRLEPLAVP